MSTFIAATLAAAGIAATMQAAPVQAAPATAPHYTLAEVKNSSTVLDEEALAMNDRGTIVGDATLPDFTSEGYTQSSNSKHFRGIQPFGGPFNRVNAIASNGDIAGGASDPGFGLEGERAFMVMGGQLVVPFPDVPGTSSVANAINAKGAATGSQSVPGGSQLGWIYDQGQLTAIPSFGGSASTGNAINAHGTVAGSAEEVGDGLWSPYLLRHGVMSRLPVRAGRQYCAVYGINNGDAVVGSCFHTTNRDQTIYAEYWHDGVVTELPDLSPGYSLASGINDAGVIVGWSLPNAHSVEPHAVAWIDGVAWDLNTVTTKAASTVLSTAMAITSDGRILVEGNGPDGNTRTYVLTPDAAAP